MIKDKWLSKKMQTIPNAYWWFALFCTLFTILMVIVEIKNGRFWTNDLKVYYQATQDFYQNNNPYDRPYGLSSGFFKYPPTTLYVFAPMVFANFFVTQFLHLLLLLIALVLSIIGIYNLTFKQLHTIQKKQSYWLYVFFAVVAIHVVREFHLGNINLLLLLFLSLGSLAFFQEKQFNTALFYSLMVILKPIMILAFIPFIFRFQHWKTLLLTAALGLIFFLLPIFHLGLKDGITIWMDWFKAVSNHSSYITSQNALGYLSSYYFGLNSEWLASIVVLTLLILMMLYDNLKLKNTDNVSFIKWVFIFVALVPNFFITDTEHFLLSLPLIALVVIELIQYKKNLLWLVFILLIAVFSLNSSDLLGEKLSAFYVDKGLLGLANLALIAFYLGLIFVKKKNVESFVA